MTVLELLLATAVSWSGQICPLLLQLGTYGKTQRDWNGTETIVKLLLIKTIIVLDHVDLRKHTQLVQNSLDALIKWRRLDFCENLTEYINSNPRFLHNTHFSYTK